MTGRLSCNGLFGNMRVGRLLNEAQKHDTREGCLMKDDSRNLLESIAGMRPWYYLVKINEDTYTIPREKWSDFKFTITHQHYIARMLKHVLACLPLGHKGLSVLDYGCNCGWLSFMLAEHGFSRVVGHDIYPKYIDQALFLKEAKKAQGVTFDADLERVLAAGPYDLTLCLGVMNHTEDPVGVLRRISECTSKCLIIDVNCFVPSAAEPFSVSKGSSHEALFGCNFNPKFDGSDGYNLEFQLSREAITVLLHRCGFFPIFEIATPLSQPSKLKYYNNRFFAVAMKHQDPDFWQQELRWQDCYYNKPVEALVSEGLFSLR